MLLVFLTVALAGEPIQIESTVTVAQLSPPAGSYVVVGSFPTHGSHTELQCRAQTGVLSCQTQLDGTITPLGAPQLDPARQRIILHRGAQVLELSLAGSLEGLDTAAQAPIEPSPAQPTASPCEELGLMLRGRRGWEDPFLPLPAHWPDKSGFTSFKLLWTDAWTEEGILLARTSFAEAGGDFEEWRTTVVFLQDSERETTLGSARNMTKRHAWLRFAVLEAPEGYGPGAPERELCSHTISPVP